MKKHLLTLYIALLFFGIIHAKNTPAITEPLQHTVPRISFTENKGQIGDQYFRSRPDVLFVGSVDNSDFILRKTGISYQLKRIDEWKESSDKFDKIIKVPARSTIYRLDINWRNANANSVMIAENVLPGHSNYYCESAPQGITNVKTYANIIYQDIYKGIDLHYYEKDGNLKYDFVVSSGSDYRQIQLEIQGAENITVNIDGSVSLKTPLGTFEEGAPVVYQNEKKLQSRWVVNGNTLSFHIENYDPSKKLIIDPVVRSWATRYGGSGEDYVISCATDGSGNSYITGRTGSASGNVIATVGSHMYSTGSTPWDGAFLAKFNNAGVRQWGTYYGGGGGDAANTCAVNMNGEIYVAGRTTVVNTPSLISTPGAHQTTMGGLIVNVDAFLVKFNSSGARIWGTYYGGNGDDEAFSVALDPVGNVYMAGVAEASIGIATPGSHQPAYGGGNYNGDGFLVKFNSAGVRQWGTYYGGGGDDAVRGVHVDVASNVFIGGYTNSYSNISSSGAHQVNYGGGSPNNNYDGFVARFDTSGVRQWGTFYGGTNGDFVASCAGDGNGNVYILGASSSTNSPAIATTGAYQSTPPFGTSSGTSAFLVKFNSGGVRQWGTYYGGNNFTYGNACTVNSAGEIYIVGHTNATSPFMATSGAHQNSNGGGNDGFLARFDPSGVRKEGTYYGGPNEQVISSCATNTLNEVYCSGYSSVSTGTGVATPGSHQPNSAGGNDGLLVKFNECTDSLSTPVDGTDHSVVFCEGSPITLSVVSTGTVSWYASSTGTSALATGLSYTIPSLSAGSYSWYASAKACNETSPRIAVSITVALCVGSSEMEKTEALVTVYPNPGDGTYSIENFESGIVKVINSAGQLLQEHDITRDKNLLNLEKYSNGIYLLMFSGTNTTQIIKVIKQ